MAPALDFLLVIGGILHLRRTTSPSWASKAHASSFVHCDRIQSWVEFFVICLPARGENS